MDRNSLHYSASQLGVFITCPEKYRQQYVIGSKPAHRSLDLIFGSVVHSTLAKFHESIQQGEALSADALLDTFTADFERDASAPDVLRDDEETVDTMRQRGSALIEEYVQEHRPHSVVAVEHRFALTPEQLPLGFPAGINLSGALDLVERDENGILWMTELKTAGRKFDEVRLRYDLQMTLYSAALRALGWPEARMRFRVLMKGARSTISTHEVHRDGGTITEGARVATQVLRAVERGIFFPIRGWQCATCAFRSVCGS